MANDYIKFGRTEFEVVGGKFVQNSIPNDSPIFNAGYLSPVSDAYKKVGLFEDKDLFKQRSKRPN